jgi:uncharacterized SAM-binding protein YcdF (DUF218 family)
LETIKSVVTWAISPLIIGLMIQSVAWLCWLKQRRGWFTFLTAIAFLILIVGSLPVFSFDSNRNREFKHRPLDPSVDLDGGRPVLIYVLGTGFNPDPELPPNSRVSGTFLSRLLEGYRIYRSRSDTRLLVSIANEDAAPKDKKAFLDAMAGLLSIEPSRIELITDAKSTEDEAKLLGGLLRGNEQLVLASSASHMPRAIDTFKALKYQPKAAPTDFHYPRAGSAEDKVWKPWIPSADGINSSHQWLREILASQLQRLKPS